MQSVSEFDQKLKYIYHTKLNMQLRSYPCFADLM
jgi:hypothetical protein